MGRPVIETEHNEVQGTVGDIVFADLNEYLMVTKGNLRADASMHVAFDYDVMAYRFITRVNGQPWWESALTPNKGGANNTLSPFVALATRA
jgi:HK97 family phage major capsid protein